FQALLGLAVATVGIGMMFLGQGLIAGLPVDHCDRPRELEDLESLLLRSGQWTARATLRLACLRLLAGTKHVHFLEQAVGIVQGVIGWRTFSARPAPERPGRPPPGNVGTRVRLDLVLGHPGVVVPTAIVIAHMLEAEPAILVQPVAMARRAEFAAERAAGMLAHPELRRRHGVGYQHALALDPRHACNMTFARSGDKMSGLSLTA